MPSRLFAFLVLLSLSVSAAAQDLTGSGSTFAYPIMARWANAYEQASGLRIQYEPIGSSGGIAEVRAGLVDFGLSEAPLVDAQLLRDGLEQFPLVTGAIVPVVNLPGIAPGQLHLTGEVLADIYLGNVKAWNDPAIAELNPAMALPAMPILVVYRSEGSGTTYNWTDYLSKISTAWQAGVGSSTTVSWPVGVAAKGNGDVAAKVGRVKGAIGYVEFAYASRAGLSYAVVRNRAGNYVPPSAAAFRAAVSAADWTAEPDFHVLLTNPAAPDAYPIMATSFVIIRRYPPEPRRFQSALQFFHWALNDGRDLAMSLGYEPLPSELTQLVEAYWTREAGPSLPAAGAGTVAGVTPRTN